MDDLARARALLEWYPTVARPLPWRRVEALGPDDRAWRVLLSELMLQQTRVETVIPYYERFVARWPTAARMAAEPVQAVLEAWAGLGYYSRARNLHACAVALATGVTPRTVDGLRALPGDGGAAAGGRHQKHEAGANKDKLVGERHVGATAERARGGALTPADALGPNSRTETAPCGPRSINFGWDGKGGG